MAKIHHNLLQVAPTEPKVRIHRASTNRILLTELENTSTSPDHAINEDSAPVELPVYRKINHTGNPAPEEPPESCTTLFFSRTTMENYITFLGIFLLLSCGEKRTATQFYELPPSETNISFNNILQQTDEFNIIEYLYFYNGGGVATGDVNNDGLIDIYFTSNQLSNKLYLNKGNFVFEDITEKAGVEGVGNWKTGVTMADVNGDGFLDIFVCGVGNYKSFEGRNQLFINNGDLTFTDKTEEYGLAFQGFSTQAVFFDYDNDGDLDMYLLNHSVHTARSYGHARLRFQSDRYAGDKLYRNDLIPEGINRFTEVTSQAGIFNSQVAYGLGVGVSDLNKDGFMDIYVSNDFHENDYLYINQGDGTFRQELEKSIPHVSRFSMGNDIADMNNDGWPDIFTLDMLPKEEGIIKTTAGEDSYDIYEFKLRLGYHYQVARNTLQLNLGLEKDGHLLFSDVAPLAGVEASDWSWAPLLADFDNDGNKDVFIANGIFSRPNDLDYINFISSDSAQRYYEYGEFIKNMPSGKVPNVFFRNQGNLRFSDATEKWIGIEPTLSTGAAYADLDNDGDLDLVVNNINQPASVYRNDMAKDSSGFLQFELRGEGANKFGIGAKVVVYAENKQIYHEQILTRGWQSSVSPVVHVGIGGIDITDSVSIIWPDKRFQTLTSVKKDQRIEVFQKDAVRVWNYDENNGRQAAIIQERKNILFEHKENDFNAFNAEKLIPHMLSTQGPKIAVGDINGDKLEDFFIGGASGQSGQVFSQDKSGNFSRTHQPALELDSLYEDIGAAFFDADGNGTLDLIVVSGGQEFSGNHANLLPRLYLNNGKGVFKKSQRNLPDIFVNASCVKPIDIDGDGDIDLFIGGRVVANHYGISPKSYILINNGKGVFSNETARLFGEINDEAGHLGMVTDALWTDLNQDGKPDLIVVGEWMPITIFIQDTNRTFQNKSHEYGLEKTNGWWNTITANDFDKDGDMDFVVGNLGLNSRLKASVHEPVSMYVGDIDNNGGTDHILTYFNQGKRHPFISRDQLVKQAPAFKRKFLKYSNFRNVTLEDIIPIADSGKYIVNHAYNFASVYLENTGNGKFSFTSLPVEAQMFPIFSFSDGDFNDDGHTDLLAVGNLYAVQPEFGRYDAGYGLMMPGDGKGNFRSLSQQSSGFVVKGEGRDIKSLVNSKGDKIYLVAINNDSLLIFKD